MTDAISKFATMDVTGYVRLGRESKRSVAVGAALELILAKASAQSSGIDLAYELDQLSHHADKIQAAMESK